MSNRIMIIDGNNICHAAYHAYSKLQNHGKPVSIIFGMPSMIAPLVGKFKPHNIFIVWDGGKSKHRLKLLPTYKAGRKSKTQEEYDAFNHQRDVVMGIFDDLGIKQVIGPHIECDDYIYMLVRKFQKDKGNKITIISNDKDFHQLLRSNVKIWSTIKRQFIHTKNIKSLFGYEAKQCVDYLILNGDSSDNIKGYHGMGEKKIKDFFSKFSSISEYLTSEDSFKGLDKSKLEELYKVNGKLINLRIFYKTFIQGKHKILYHNKKPKANLKSLFKTCNEYSIRLFKTNQFLKNFGL